jgi:beta-galactosidase
MDVLGVNYQEPYFPLYRKADPNVVVIGTEVFKYWRSTEDNLSAFDPANTWWDVVRHDYVAGQFLWTGIDYFGEFGGFPRHGSTCGIIDSCGLLKPEGMFQRSVWRKDPVVFITVVNDSLGSGARASAWDAPIMLPHWSFPKYQGQLLRLQTQTNCETVELILNGISYGVRRAADYLNSAVVWHVPYQPGKIEAIGRTGGEIAARHELVTAGPCGQIVLKPDRTSIAADGQDVSHVEVNLADREGVLVPDDDRTIRFELSGPGVIIGVDNGDMLSLEPFKANSRRTVAGRCLAIVQSARKPGVIRLVASASGLPAASATIQTA